MTKTDLKAQLYAALKTEHIPLESKKKLNQKGFAFFYGGYHSPLDCTNAATERTEALYTTLKTLVDHISPNTFYVYIYQAKGTYEGYTRDMLAVDWVN